jgi:hypothetical protein
VRVDYGRAAMRCWLAAADSDTPLERLDPLLPLALSPLGDRRYRMYSVLCRATPIAIMVQSGSSRVRW